MQIYIRNLYMSRKIEIILKINQTEMQSRMNYRTIR